MADKDYKAFIVEGEAREPQIIENLSKIFFRQGNVKIITLPAGENIYMLWKKLKDDEFDTDIIEVLRESNVLIREQLAELSRDDFSEVFLFFDYDAHQTNLGKTDEGNAVRQMLESFDNETENGKLYISYPMVEALRDFEPETCGSENMCYMEVKELINYKNISAMRSYNPHFKEYDINVWRKIIDVFAMRISCLYGYADTIEYAYYSEHVNPYEVYRLEELEAQRERVFILSAFPEFLIDYFGIKLWKTSVKHMLNLRNKSKCKSYVMW